MADTAVAITAGTGTNIDTRTEGTNGNHRQVLVIGDPATNAGVAPVDVTAGLKVDLGSDNDVTNGGTFAVQSTLQTGSNAIGKLAANSGVDIGDVDILSIAAGDNNIGNVDIASALPAGTNGIGKLTANSGVDIGDVDVTSITGVTMSNAAIQTTGDEAHDAIDAGNPIKVGGRAQTSEAQPEEVADNDRVDALFDRNGYLRVRGDFDPSFAAINDAGSGDNEIIAAQAAGKRIAVWAILVVSDGTTDVRFEDGAAGAAFTGQVPLQAREGYSISAGGLVPLFVGSAATALNMELTAAVNVHGFVSFTVMDD